MQTPLSARLDDSELEELARYLESLPGAMSLEMLDGFFAALVCSPELVLPSSYWPFVWGQSHAFANGEEAQTYSNLLIRHWNSIADDLSTARPFDPILLEYEGGDSVGEEWAVGFMQGMRIGGEAWKELLHDDDNGGLLIPILALAHENDPDVELRPDPIDEEKRSLMLASLAAFVLRIYRYFLPHRQGAASVARPAARPPFRHAARKTGRNEPCPCGSGKKYKHCCGRG